MRCLLRFSIYPCAESIRNATRAPCTDLPVSGSRLRPPRMPASALAPPGLTSSRAAHLLQPAPLSHDSHGLMHHTPHATPTQNQVFTTELAPPTDSIRAQPCSHQNRGSRRLRRPTLATLSIMQQLPLLLLLLCALAPSSFPRGGDVPPVAAPLVHAAPIRHGATHHSRSSNHDGVVAFARPHSLVLPTCQRPHVIAHRGGESCAGMGSPSPKPS